MINSPTRYPYAVRLHHQDINGDLLIVIWQVTLNQGAVETILLNQLEKSSISVDRPTRPSSLVLSSDEKELQDPDAYPVKACARKQNAPISFIGLR